MTTLTPAQERRLDAMRNRLTTYEVALVTPSGAKFRVGYTQRRSFRGLLALVVAYEDAIARVSDLTGDEPASRHGGELRLGDATVRFTGRTARDAILEGELPGVIATALKPEEKTV